MNIRTTFKSLTIPEFINAVDNEVCEISSKKSISFSQENTEYFKESNAVPNLLNPSPRMRFEDSITPKFTNNLTFEKKAHKEIDLQSKLWTYYEEPAINDRSIDEHHSPTKQLRVINASSFKKNSDDEINCSYHDNLRVDLGDSLSMSIEEAKFNRMCAIEKIKCGCKLF